MDRMKEAVQLCLEAEGELEEGELEFTEVSEELPIDYGQTLMYTRVST